MTETEKTEGIPWPENDKWIKFTELQSKTKTRVIAVSSKCDGSPLGQIKWYSAWRHYCWFPFTEFQTVFSDRCLETLCGLLRLLNEEHKKKVKA